jgi:hypothetical protein
LFVCADIFGRIAGSKAQNVPTLAFKMVSGVIDSRV